MLVMLGLDHRKTSVETRGLLALTDEKLRDAIATLSSDPAIDETVIVSTCNRVELYLASDAPDTAARAARRFLEPTLRRALTPVASTRDSAPKEVSQDEINDAIYEERGIRAVSHLYRVASGLRSMVIGEAQILGQVREALAAAEGQGAVGEQLRSAFTGALQAGKRVRTDTALSRADASVAGLAIHAARVALGPLEGKRVTLVGAGKTIEICAALLADQRIGRLVIANRHVESARALAETYAAKALPLADASEAIAESDLLISATAAPYPVISADMVTPREDSHPLLIIDLAVPGDVESRVASSAGISLITLDTLRDLPASALDDPAMADALTARQADIEDAERIIESALRDYSKAQTLRLAAPGIAALRKHVDQSEEQELAQVLAQLAHLSEQDRALIKRFGARLVDKMFNHLVRRIRTLAEYEEIPPETTMRVLAQLFAEPESK
jgi:glutamyl-tRNA reductase